MRVLVVKLTSMGDALHVLPALTDLQVHNPDVVVDWMIEDTFAEIPSWHDSVHRVIKVSTRRWRNFNRANITEFLSFWKLLRSERYDVVIDAQGLIKSAVFARFAKLNQGGVRAGFSGASIKENSMASKLTLLETNMQWIVCGTFLPACLNIPRTLARQVLVSILPEQITLNVAQSCCFTALHGRPNIYQIKYGAT